LLPEKWSIAVITYYASTKLIFCKFCFNGTEYFN